MGAMSRLRIAVKFADPEVLRHVVERLEFVGETTVQIADPERMPQDVGALFTDDPATPRDASTPVIGVVSAGLDPQQAGSASTLRLPLQLQELLGALHAAAQLREQRT